MVRRGFSRARIGAVAVAFLAYLAPGAVSGQSGPRIRNIVIQTENVFEDAESSILTGVADALHAVTREPVVRRELLFQEGDSLDPAKLLETERNLRALGLFRQVEVRAIPAGEDEVDVLVRTRDAWTTEITGSIGQAGGQSRFGLGMEENNFLGLGKKLSIAAADGPDRTTREVLYGDPQFLGRRLALLLLYGSNSDGERRRLVLDHPFRSLDSPDAESFVFEDLSRQTRIYDAGLETARYGMRTRFLELEAGGRITVAGDRPVLRVFAGYRRTETFFDELPEEEGGRGEVPPDRKFGFVFGRIELSKPDFAVQRDVAFYSRDEDFDLGGAASLELGWSPPVFGANESIGAALSLARGLRLPGGFLRGSLAASTRAKDRSFENALVEGDLLAVWRPDERSGNTLVGRVRVAVGSRLDPEIQLAADGATGLRGYRLHAFTGDRRLLVNVEDRILLTPELLHLFQVGGAIFFDAGYAWPVGAPARLSDLRADAGVGLRIGLPRAAKHALFRIDLAYALRPDLQGRRGWLVSFSSSQAF